MTLKLTLRLVPGTFAISRLAANDPLPDWLGAAPFSAMIRAEDEMTVVCDQASVPDMVHSDRDWACLRTVGPFPFEAAGIVRTLIGPLSENGIGVFVLCTFDGEHLLVKHTDLDRAAALLAQAGHVFEG